MIGRSQLLRRISASSIVYIVLLGTVLAVAVPVALATDRTIGREVEHWQPALDRAADILAGAVDQETGVRGYVLTGRDSFLGPYESGAETIDAAFTDLDQLVTSADARAQVGEVRAALETWRREEAEPAIRRVEAGNPDAAARILEGGGEPSRFDDFRAEQGALAAMLRDRAATARDDVRELNRIVLLVLATGTALTLALALLVRRWVGRSVEQYDATVAEVEQRERRFRTLVDASASLVWESDATGCFVEPQPSWSSYTGQPWAEHAGRGWAQAIHPDDRKRFLAEWDDALAQPRVHESEARLWHAASGAHRRVMLRAAPIVDGDEVVEWIGTVTDVEDARRAEARELEALRALSESEERHRALVESSAAIRFTTDAEGRFVEPQDEWRRYTSQSWEKHRDFGWVEMLHPADRAPVLAAWREAVARGTDYRGTGRLWHAASTTYRWFEARAVARHGPDAEIVEWAGTITDVHERRVAEHRVAAMAALTRGLATASTTDEVLDTTIGVLAEHLDAQLLGLGLTHDDHFRILRVTGVPDDFEIEIDVPLDTLAPAVDAIRTKEVLSLTERERTVWYPGPTVWQQLGMQSAAYAPIIAGGTGIGVVVLGYTTQRRVPSDEKAMLLTMGELVGQALSRARLFEFERSIATVLQESMLPTEPLVDGDVHLASRYVPAVATLDVGGDWYDVIPLGRQIGIAVGDVVGRGIAAAAVMGQLRSALGAAALTTDSPGSVLTLLDRFARHTPGAAVTTCAYLVLDPANGAICHSSAGHPPPLVVDPDGVVRFLRGGLGPPLAATPDAADRPEQESKITPGSTILLYTDGLVERRGEHLDEGFARLGDAVARHRDLPVEQLCDTLLDEMLAGRERRDDVALVAVRTSDASTGSFVRHLPADPRSLAPLRHDLDAWLLARGVDAATERADIVLAVGEAAANAIEHAYDPAGAEVVGIEVSLRGREVWLTIRDTGRWRAPRHDPTRGRGLEVMRALMDVVEVDASPRGTTITLRRRLSSVAAPAADAAMTDDEAAPDAVPAS